MKKISLEKRKRDVLTGIDHRKRPKRITSEYRIFEGKIIPRSKKRVNNSWRSNNEWLKSIAKEGLKYTIRKKRVYLHLPEQMNFSNAYEETVLYIKAIRKLVSNINGPNKAYKLANVSFDGVNKISSPAAIVLTAELSKWEDNLGSFLTPKIDDWNKNIIKQLSQLGFFDLFRNNPINDYGNINDHNTDINYIKYIKGKTGDETKIRELKLAILALIEAPKISQWTFLASGLSEAITNVTHHAYPNDFDFKKIDKHWYMSGAYNKSTSEIKIVFYDQGIGIPNSLPTSEIWEKVLDWLSAFPIADRKKDEVLLKAAVDIERTSTHLPERGKGLQDLLEFIRQRKEGYLSIITKKGLYKFSINNGKEHVKSDRFKSSLDGTLIIWRAKLLTE